MIANAVDAGLDRLLAQSLKARVCDCPKCRTARGIEAKQYLPANGIGLNRTEAGIEQTAFALYRATLYQPKQWSAADTMTRETFRLLAVELIEELANVGLEITAIRHKETD